MTQHRWILIHFAWLFSTTLGCLPTQSTPLRAPTSLEGPEVANAQILSDGSGGGNSARMAVNPWWPMVPGNQWHFQKTDNGHPLTISIRPSPARFGCATNPIHVFFEKHHLDAYWGPGIDANLHWILGAQPNGDLMGYGHYVESLDGQMGTDTMNYRTNTPGVPAYFLIPGNPKHFQSSTSRHSLPATAGITDECIPADDNFFSTWNVVWSFETVETPAYTGPALRVQFDEQSGGRQIEDWYFVYGLGVVRIAVKEPNGRISVDMRLTSYELFDVDTFLERSPASPPPPSVIPDTSVTLRKNGTPESTLQIVEVAPGDVLDFDWSTTRASSIKVFYSTDGSDNCADGFRAEDIKRVWSQVPLQGSRRWAIEACMDGHFYQLAFQGTSSSGHVTSKTISFKVTAPSSELRPSASISLDQSGREKFKEVDPGEQVTYHTVVRNAARTETYYYATAPDHCPGGWTKTDLRKSWIEIPLGVSAASGAALSCQEARAYTIVLLAYSPSGRQVARDQVTVSVRGSIKQQMDAATVSQPKNQWVWAWWYHRLTGIEVPPIENFVTVDPVKAAVEIPLDDWWACTQELNCARMAAAYAPSQPPPMQPPTVTNSGGGCGCECAWVLGRHFYDGSMEVHVRKADWTPIGQVSPWVTSLSSLQFWITPEMKSEFMSDGLRFTLFNPTISQWTTTEPVTCSSEN